MNGRKRFDYEVWDLDSGNMIFYSHSSTEIMDHMLEWGQDEHKSSLRLLVGDRHGTKMVLMFDMEATQATVVNAAV